MSFNVEAELKQIRADLDQLSQIVIGVVKIIKANKQPTVKKAAVETIDDIEGLANSSLPPHMQGHNVSASIEGEGDLEGLSNVFMEADIEKQAIMEKQASLIKQMSSEK